MISPNSAALPKIPGVHREIDGYMRLVLAKQNRDEGMGGHQEASGVNSPIGSLNPSISVNGEIQEEAIARMTLATVPPNKMCNKTEVSPAKVPTWLFDESQVLRFVAYLLDKPIDDGGRVMPPSLIACSQVRSFTITYYLHDGTLSMDEQRQANSGIIQGKFLKRMKVHNPNADGEGYYRPEDIHIGGDMCILGRNFRVIDSDKQTRSWYKEKFNVILPEAKIAQDDSLASGQCANKLESSPARQQSNGVRREKGEYYKKDRSVMRFFCKYQDYRLHRDTCDYVLYYYLIDDTCEVKEIASTGRQSFPNLLRRQRLPKDSFHVPTTYGGISNRNDGVDGEVEYYTWKDLLCGKAISVYGRHLLLMGCDKLTSEWYANKGIHQQLLPIGQEEVKHQSDIIVPPYNGFGNERDLYAIGVSLEPKEANHEDYTKFVKGDKKVGRFQASLINVQGTDASRAFVINYFLVDDTLSIFEPPVRNSGIVGGVFLARGRYKKYIPTKNQVQDAAEGAEHHGEKSATNGGGRFSRWLCPTDFVPGSIITFETPQSGSRLFTMEVVGFDEYTRKLLEDKSIFPMSSAQLSLIRLSEIVCSGGIQARAFLQVQDKSRVGTLPFYTFIEALTKLEDLASEAPSAKPGLFRLSKHDQYEIACAFADTTKCVKGSDSLPPVFYNDVVDSLVVASPKTANFKEKSGLPSVEDRILRALRADFDSTCEGGQLRSVIRLHDPKRTGLISRGDWINVLYETNLNTILTKQVAESLCDERTSSNGMIIYDDLCNYLFNGDFNTSITATQTTSDCSTANTESSSVLPLEPGSPHHGIQQQRTEVDESNTGATAVGSSITPTSHNNKNGYSGAAPTAKQYLHVLNEELVSANGDEDKRLVIAMKSFCSAFARSNRMKMIRKHFLAFDVTNTGKITQAQFIDTAKVVAAEFFIDYDSRDRDALATFFFPSDRIRVDYEALLRTINSRDAIIAKKFREEVITRPSECEEIFASDNSQRSRDFGGSLNLFSGT